MALKKAEKIPGPRKMMMVVLKFFCIASFRNGFYKTGVTSHKAEFGGSPDSDVVEEHAQGPRFQLMASGYDRPPSEAL